LPVRVLLDESLPHDLAAELLGHDVQTVVRAGWAGLQNGELLRRARGQFDVFVTMDQNIPFQQNVPALKLGVVVLRAASNRMADLRPLISALLAALDGIQPGELLRVGA
jgi:hypothetical protein